MILMVLLIIASLALCEIYAILATKENRKLFWLCTACWFVCAVLNLYSLLAR